MSLAWFRPSRRIGLDIQADKIHLVLASKRHQTIIERVATLNLSDSGPYWDQVKSALMEFADEAQIGTVPAVVCLSAEAVRMQSLSLPSGLSDNEIRAEIVDYLQSDIPELTDALAIDFCVLGEEAGQSKVLFAAIREEHMKQYVETVASCRFPAKILEMDASAMQRMVFHCLPLANEKGLMALISLSEEALRLVMFDRQKIVFHLKLMDSAQLKQSIQLGLAKSNELMVSQFIVCGEERKADDLINHIQKEWHGEVVYLNVLSQLIFSEDQQADFYDIDQAAYLAAFGAVMRELPPW